MNKLINVGLLSLSVLLGACKKEVAECTHLTRAPQAFLDYWYFPEGSSWVQDSADGNFLRRYHLTRGVGFTRKVYTQIGTWELIAYKINR